MVIELFLIGVGLSMDAFAVSVCKGLGMEKINKKHALLSVPLPLPFLHFADVRLLFLLSMPYESLFR
jgi:putative Mn2+ efflux pump MntP